MDSPKHTRTGARRSGDDYQDIVALDIMVEMLEHSDRYQWIQVEADDFGALDDIVALRTDGSYDVKQVKFAVDSENDPVDWEYLLEQKKGKKGDSLPSLLKRWSSTLEDISTTHQICEASLISNRKASVPIQNLLWDRVFNFEKLNDAEIKEKIIQQIGDEKKAKNFFNNFHFYLDRPNITDYENKVQRRFYLLGGKPGGWLNLKNELRSWIRIRNEPPPNGLITLKHIEKAALWNQIEQMPENFEIPTDYVIPDCDFYNQFQEAVISGKQNCFVLYASPGAGKSTFISYLYQQLREKDIPVIRHHYFLSPSDPTIDRVEHEKIAKSLMGEMKHNYEYALGESENNPEPADLHKWVKTCGQFFQKQGKRLIIIIDGLDHVWREQKSIKNLDKLFEHLIPSPEGITIVVGTQPIDNKHLPSRLGKFSPNDQWIELPLLEIKVVKKWLEIHKAELNIPPDDLASEGKLERLSEAFHKKSNGHPLHLKYSLRTLIERDMLITEKNINDLPGCSHNDIINYYEELWKNLSEQSREILHLFAVTKFPWPPTSIIDCIDPEGRNLAQVNTDLKQIKHLVINNYLGLQLFHASLSDFVKNHQDHQFYAYALKAKVLRWIQTKAPSYWRWAYEWQIESELGNSISLISGLTRKWCIENIAKRYSWREATQLFTLGIKSVLNAGNIPELVRIGLLRGYYNNIFEHRDDIIKELFQSQLILNEDNYLTYRLYDNLNSLSQTEIVYLAEHEKKQNNKPIVNKCFVELNRRFAKRQDDRKYIGVDRDLRIEALNKTAALATDEVTIDRFYKYLCSNRENGCSADICETYCKELWLSKNSRSLRELLQKDLTDSEHQITIKYAVLLGFQENINLKSDVLNPKSSHSPFAAIYCSLKIGISFNFGVNWTYSPDLFKLAEHDSKRKTVTNAFHNIFFTFLANHLLHNAALNDNLIRDLDAYVWVKEFLKKFNKISFELSNIFLQGSKVEYRWLYNQFNGFKRPNWPEDRDFSDYGFAAERALYQISFDLMVMGVCDRITEQDLLDVFNSEFCYLWSWIDTYIYRRKSYMDEKCCSWFLDQQVTQFKRSIEQFEERTSHLAKLAYISIIHGNINKAKGFVLKAAENLLTHGGHSDRILFDVLEIIKVCHDARITTTKEWFLKTIPLITAFGQFTDGDGESDLSAELAKVMSKVMPETLPKYYRWLADKEDYYKALDVFHVFLRTADLSDEINQALAKTAIDDKSIIILNERANSGEQNAQKILDDISNFLGGIEISKKKDESGGTTTSSLLSEKKNPNPSDYPPKDLLKYFEVAKAFTTYERGMSLMPWLDYWIETDKKEAAFQAIVKEEERGGRLGLENYDKLYKIALSLYGKSEAYTWLVKAHIERGGWSKYYAREDEAILRWKIVKQDYPEKWLDFIKDTMKSAYGNELDFSIHERVVRLVKYSIFMNQIDLAKKIAGQVVTNVLELLSPIDLPRPEWLDIK